MEIMISKNEGTVPVSVMHLRGALDSHTYEQFISKAQAIARLAHPALTRRSFGFRYRRKSLNWTDP